ncbi:small multi-drug export protein [Paenibacillus sp. GD4]|jgi:uncharacterized membrane protein|uniref:small multi-drug export protein n=1 Tax=Paenibacillus TaxID=44249 RepID=UPI002542BCE4|nr:MULTISPECIES: small multi-drug export protein [Paenibacillus]MDQ1912174.1 small multi-drug export protein [Paenibacillus sp. GD4]
MLEEMQGWGTAWQYVVLFLMAAAPWLEVFLVVPLGIAWGLNPVAVSVTGFLGNFIPLLLIGFFFTQISAWLQRRRQRKAQKQGVTEEEIAARSAKKEKRAKGIWERYGVPGLALLAPAIIGTDLAALLALSFGSSPRYVMIWMTISLAVWTVLLAVGTVFGLTTAGWPQHK